MGHREDLRAEFDRCVREADHVLAGLIRSEIYPLNAYRHLLELAERRLPGEDAGGYDGKNGLTDLNVGVTSTSH